MYVCVCMCEYMHIIIYRWSASKVLTLYNGEFGSFLWISISFVVSTNPILMIFCRSDFSAGEICSSDVSSSLLESPSFTDGIGMDVEFGLSKFKLVTYTRDIQSMYLLHQFDMMVPTEAYIIFFFFPGIACFNKREIDQPYTSYNRRK